MSNQPDQIERGEEHVYHGKLKGCRCIDDMEVKNEIRKGKN